VNETAMWTAYAAGNSEARDALLRQHLGLVHFVARQVFRKLSTEADFDDLLGAGTLGLIGALESFDQNRGLAFSTFAAPRIRGSILDDLRRLDHVSRSVRRKARELAAARAELARTLGRPHVDRELAIRLDLDIPRLWRWESEVEGAMMVSLDRMPGDRDDEAPALTDTLFADGPTIEDVLEREEQVALLAQALAGLNGQEQTVLTLSYYEGLKLHEIATVLGVTESRVSQIRTKALAKLRSEISPRLAAVA